MPVKIAATQVILPPKPSINLVLCHGLNVFDDLLGDANALVDQQELGGNLLPPPLFNVSPIEENVNNPQQGYDGLYHPSSATLTADPDDTEFTSTRNAANLKSELNSPLVVIPDATDNQWLPAS